MCNKIFLGEIPLYKQQGKQFIRQNDLTAKVYFLTSPEKLNRKLITFEIQTTKNAIIYPVDIVHLVREHDFTSDAWGKVYSNQFAICCENIKPFDDVHPKEAGEAAYMATISVMNSLAYNINHQFGTDIELKVHGSTIFKPGNNDALYSSSLLQTTNLIDKDATTNSAKFLKPDGQLLETTEFDQKKSWMEFSYFMQAQGVSNSTDQLERSLCRPHQLPPHPIDKPAECINKTKFIFKTE